MDCLPDKVGDMVKACVGLHNYLASTDAAHAPAARYIPDNYTDSTTASGELQRGEWRTQVEGDSNLQDQGRLSGVRASRAGHERRDGLCDFFQTPHGMVPWQDDIIRRGRLQ